MRLLAGDIGGTKVLLQLAEFEQGKFRALAEQRFASAAYAGLAPMVRDFLSGVDAMPAPDAACFGIAGPVESTPGGQRARTTNLPWVIETDRLKTELGMPRVRLINDFQAIGYAIDGLEPSELVTLQEGERVPGAPAAVVGAGTGLGQALLIWDGDHYESMPTEGGHVDFAPTDETQVELLRSLTGHYERVSYERILSGAGLMSLYGFFRDRADAKTKASNIFDTPAAVSAAALASSDAAAVSALRLFVFIYGSHAGNVALSYLARGGVYIAGGIAPKILPALQEGTFMQAFTDKGRMQVLMKRFPVRVVTNEKAGLLGAALAASRLI